MARRPKTGLSRKQEDDLLREYHLMRAFGSAEPVTIDGVTLDLSCDLDTTLWRPIAALGTYGLDGWRFGPRIAFPWTPADVVKHWRSDGRLVEAPAGSVVRIASVQSMPLTTAFKELDQAENQERKIAYLWVFPPEGNFVVAEPPLQLIAETATAIQLELENYGPAYRGLLAKLERLLGWEDIEEIVEKRPIKWPRPPEHLSAAYRRALLALHRALTNGDEHAYVAFGYLMSRAEAEHLLLDSALREHKAAEHRSRGAAVRSSNSRKNTEVLRNHAKRLVLGMPNMTLYACSRAVSKAVAADATWKMSSDPPWIADQIRELFEQRMIRGQLEYRPKKEWVSPA